MRMQNRPSIPPTGNLSRGSRRRFGERTRVQGQSTDKPSATRSPGREETTPIRSRCARPLGSGGGLMTIKQNFADQLKTQSDLWTAQLKDYQERLEEAGEKAR